jgi:hypothetical protein
MMLAIRMLREVDGRPIAVSISQNADFILGAAVRSRNESDQRLLTLQELESKQVAIQLQTVNLKTSNH